MSRKRLAWTMAGALATVFTLAGIAGLLVLRSSWFHEKVRARIVSTVETATGGRAEVGEFQFDWTRLRAEVKMFVIHGTEPAGKPPLLRVGSADVGIKIVSIFRRDVDIAYLELTDPHFYLMIYPDGHTNIPEPKVRHAGGRPAGEAILDLAVGRFVVRNGLVEVESRGKTRFNGRGQNLHAKFDYDSLVPRYRGDLSMQPLELQFGDYGAVPFDVIVASSFEKNRIRLDSVKLTTGATHVEISGAIEDLASPHGEFQYTAGVSLADVSRIFRVPELRRGSADVAGAATWRQSSEIAATGNLRAHDVEYRDSFVRLVDFRIDGAVAASAKGIDVTGVRLSGNQAGPKGRVPLTGRVATVGLRGKDLSFRGVVLDALGGSFTGDGELKGLDRYTVGGKVGGLAARRVVTLYSNAPLPWDGLVSGSAHLEGSLRRPKNLRASAALSIEPAPDSAPVRGQITANFEADSGILDLGRSTLALPSSSAAFSGAIGRSLQVHLETRDFNDLLPALGQNTDKFPVRLMNGSVVFDGTVDGKLDRPQINGHARATNISYAEQVFNSFETDLTVSPDIIRLRNAALARGTLRANLEGDAAWHEWKIDAETLIFGNGTIRGAAVSDLVAMGGSKNVPLTGILSGSARVSGTVGKPQVAGDIQVAEGALSGEPFDQLTAHVDYSGSSVNVTAGQIKAGTKQVAVNATFDHAPNRLDTGRLRFHVESNAMPLEQVKTLRETREGVQGTVQVAANGTVDLSVSPNGGQTFRVADLHADVSAKGLQLTGQTLGDAHMTAESQGQVLRAHLESNVANSEVRGDGEWRLEDDYSGTATVKFSRLDFAQLRDWISPSQAGSPSLFAGSAEGEFRIDGPLLKRQLLKAELRIPKIELGPPPQTGLTAGSLVVRNEGPIVARMANSVVTVDQAHLTGAYTDLRVTGRVLTDPKVVLDLRATGRVNLALLRDFSRDLFASGTVVGDATIRGSLDQPQVSGRTEFENATFSIADLPNGISNAKGVVLFTGDRATIQNLSGETGGGTIDLSGFAAYAGGQPVFRIHARADEVRVRYPEGVSNVANASLDLTGTTDRSMLAGTVTILRTGVNLQSDFSSVLAKSAEPVRTPSAQAGFLGGLNFDIQIDTAPDIQFQSTLTENLQAEATLRLRGTASNPALLGRVNITQGQVIFFGTKYTINQGTVAFYNPVKVEPILNIDLETKARGVDVTLTVSGPANKLNLTPRSDPPLQFSEIVALLATGRTPTSDPALLTHENSSPQSWQQVGASALLGQAIANPVAGRLQRFFGVSKLRIDPTLPGVENNPQARLTLEQQVTPEITFTYITNVTSSNPQVVRVEWSFSKQWSVVALREENGLLGMDFFFKKRFR